jgi:hypothetical protein
MEVRTVLSLPYGVFLIILTPIARQGGKKQKNNVFQVDLPFFSGSHA